MKVEGACHCGAIAYEAEVDPAGVEICHCTDCQTLTGTAFRVSVTTPAASLRLLRGRPNTYVRTAESGNRRAQAFCGTCGTPLWSVAAGDPQAPHTLRVGAMKQRDQLPPRRQFWCRSAQPWTSALERLPGVARE